MPEQLMILIDEVKRAIETAPDSVLGVLIAEHLRLVDELELCRELVL